MPELTVSKLTELLIFGGPLPKSQFSAISAAIFYATMQLVIFGRVFMDSCGPKQQLKKRNIQKENNQECSICNCVFTRKLQNCIHRRDKRILKFRTNDHCGYVYNSIDTATGSHFTQQCHSPANLQLTATEQTKKTSDNGYRKECEEYFMRQFNTVNKGINRKY